MSIDELITYIFTPAAQVALVIGLVEVAKRLGLPKAFAPLMDVALGIVTGVVAFGLILGYGIPTGIYVGLAVGLAAGGMFDVVKKTAERITANKEDTNGDQ